MRIRIRGGRALNGTFSPAGNPNAAKALLAASLLTLEPVTLRRVPRNTSTAHLLAAAEALGAVLTWQDPTSGTLQVQTEIITGRTLNRGTVSGAVGTLLFLPALIARREHVRLEVGFPLSRIRTHLDVMRDLGLDIITMSGAVEFRARYWDNRDVILDTPSVTATAIALMLAARLGRQTIIRNAACEPHIGDLAQLLVAMGVGVDGVGSNVLTVRGAMELHGADVAVGYDHIEIASVAAIVALSGGRLQVPADDGAALPDMRVIARTYGYFGLNIDADERVVLVPRHERFAVTGREEDIDASVETAPYPGFPSDLVTLATVIATQASGTSLIHEKLFRDRMLFVDTLKDMGAQIILAGPHRAIVVGGTPLQGTYMAAPDPRFGLGMLGAALIAQGDSVIDNAERFDYTFDGILPRLQELGADIVTETNA
jgi:UDP-N-acetylglucosamine 1-carboxyvinyltransferase